MSVERFIEDEKENENSCVKGGVEWTKVNVQEINDLNSVNGLN